MASTDECVDSRMLLARYVRQQRESLNLPIEDAAAIAGIPYSKWCALEIGQYHPHTPGTLRAIAETLTLNLEECAVLSNLGRTSCVRLIPGEAE